jgi:putative nucleotidyltransferase with HDIG domain
MPLKIKVSEILDAAKPVSLPDIYIRLKSILDDPDHSLAEVAVLISRDPALTLRLLNIVNSSFFSFAVKVDTVSRAITLLGTQQIHDLVLATSVVETFKGMSSAIMDMQRFWRQSLFCAAICRNAAFSHPGCNREQLFVAGLLHDIGHLLIYQARPERAQQAMGVAKEKGVPLFQVERELLGFDYAMVGAELMRKWTLPEHLAAITEKHVEPESATIASVETAIVHLGAVLCRSEAPEAGCPPMAPELWARIRISPEECGPLVIQSQRDLLVLTSVFENKPSDAQA